VPLPRRAPEITDWQSAFDRLTEIKRLRPDLLPLARSLWRPDEYGTDPSKNDLQVFRNDPDFERLLTSS
jgi:hypothetical protein